MFVILGQFNQPWDKRQPYDTDIRVPLLIRGPGLIPKSISDLPFQSVDLAPTILQMAGLPIPNYMDGQPLLKHIIHGNSKKAKWETNILIEYHGEGNAESNDVNCPWGQDNTLAVELVFVINILSSLPKLMIFLGMWR